MWRLISTQSAIDTASGLPHYFNHSLVEVPVQRIAAKRVEPQIIQEPKQEKEMNRHEDQPTTKGSNEISKEMKQLRYKYIVGKWTGMDLSAKSGKLIAAKHTPITKAIVDEADKEGLLALLIVHMTTPGLEEEE